jgi:hypothetical protein
MSSKFAITQNKGFHLVFANGWTASVQFGAGNYCDNRHNDFGSAPKPSSTAEVACWGPNREMVDIMDSGDVVIGWQSTNDVLVFLNNVASQP